MTDGKTAIHFSSGNSRFPVILLSTLKTRNRIKDNKTRANVGTGGNIL
jgi:hypothetical protein